MTALKTVFVICTTLILRNPRILLLYFTQIIYFAFLRRISMEKKQLEIKNKILEKTDFDEVFDANEADSNNWSDYNSIKDAVHNKLRYQ